MIGLTPRQRDALAFIGRYAHKHKGVSPSYAEIAAGLGLTSKDGAHRLVHALVARGHLKMLPGKARSLAPVGRPRRGPRTQTWREYLSAAEKAELYTIELQIEDCDFRRAELAKRKAVYCQRGNRRRAYRDQRVSPGARSRQALPAAPQSD